MRIEIPKSQTYIESLASPETLSKRKSRMFAEDLGLGDICLSPSEGHLLAFLVRMHGARKFVEIGTLTGLSAQYLCEGMGSHGQLWTLEKTELHAKLAREALQEHPLQKNVNIVVGDARMTLRNLEVSGPFDGIFIDGNKAAYMDYLEWSEKNVRPGGLVVADNVFLSGSVWGNSDQQKFSEKQIAVMQAFNRRLADPTLYDSVILPTTEGLYVAVKMF